ncbi:hypothetical protein JCM19232_4572 [Vibrio ishigakensis]|uniref:Uncharacterized protein n=1 Tax=Vibrio ishigakensis TaxID=1481914 RepID=A0A0B8P7U4_9VIBR|nr:hypothetical protein JCM19232_4572 [Vibrio ishigakensis]
MHDTGIPFNDPSGDRLREWMGVSKEVFYDENRLPCCLWGSVFQEPENLGIYHHDQNVPSGGENNYWRNCRTLSSYWCWENMRKVIILENQNGH